MIFLKSFLIGGIICALVQILLDKTKLLPGRVMVLLVVLEFRMRINQLLTEKSV